MAEGRPKTAAVLRRLQLAAVLAGLALVVVFIGAPMGLFSGTRPDNLGVNDGRLAPPKRTPNCVSSQADKDADAQHYIAPLRYSGDAQIAWSALRRVVEAMPRAQLVREEPRYLYVEFTSKLMRYVDDVEFYLDEKAGVVQVRSASRLGRRDYGVNRERVESIRAQLARSGILAQ